MEQANNQVGSFLFLNNRDPLAGGFHHVDNFHAAPELVGQLMGNTGLGQSEDGDLDALAGDDGIGREIGLAAFSVNDVGADVGHVEFGFHLVVDRMTGFDVMVTDRDHVILEEIQGIGPDVGDVGLDEIVVVDRRLTLEGVAIVHQDDFVAGGALRSHEGGNLRHRGRHGSASDEVVRENGAVDIGGLNEIQNQRRVDELFETIRDARNQQPGDQHDGGQQDQCFPEKSRHVILLKE